MPRVAVLALVVCVLSAAAAVVSFVQGNWLGVVWVALVGVSSNTAWYLHRKAKADRRRTAACPTGKVPASCAVRCGACGEA